MASYSTSLSGNVEGFQDVLSYLLKPDPGALVGEAIRDGNKERVIETSLHLKGLSTIGPKKEAIIQRKVDLLELLLETDSTITEELVATACQQRDMDIVRVLLNFGWHINAPIYSAASLLCFAINDKSFMQQLIENGANVNARSKLDEPVLSIAIVDGSKEVVSFLIDKGADVTHGDLLHCAAERKNQSEGAGFAKDLANRGADVNAYRHDNSVARILRGMSQLLTPLHVACYKQNVPVARVLLQHGANPDQMSLKAGQLAPPTALEIAQTKNNEELISLLSTFRT